MEKILCLILLYSSNNNSIGERFFIGVLSGLFLYIIFYFINKVKEDKETDRRNKIQEHFENKEEELQEKNYYALLKEIATDSKLKLHFNYDTTISQLKEKCNPKYYIDKNDYSKLRIATEIYSELVSAKEPLDKRKIRLLRVRANEQLGVMFSSEYAYNILNKVFNPNNFVDENFDADKLLACTKAHKYILENREDLRKLEQFAYKIGFLKL